MELRYNISVFIVTTMHFTYIVQWLFFPPGSYAEFFIWGPQMQVGKCKV